MGRATAGTSAGSKLAGSQIQADGIPLMDAGAIRRFENYRKRFAVGCDRQVAEVDDGIKFQPVVADHLANGGKLLPGRGGRKSAGARNNVRSLLAAGEDAGKSLVEVRVAGEHEVRPQTRRLARLIDIGLRSRGAAMPGIGGERRVMEGEHNGPPARLAVWL